MTDLKHSIGFSRWRAAQQARRQTALPGRWLGWARAVGLRYLRSAIRPQSLALVLAQKHAMICARLERWEHAALTICPRINVTLSSIVWPPGGAGASTRNLIQTSFRTLSQNWTKVSSQLVRLPHGGAVEPLLENNQTHSGIRSHQSAAEILDAPSSLEIARRSVDSVREVELLPGLHRVLARLRYREGRDVSPGLVFDSSVTRHSFALIRRVMDERRRIEDQTYRVLTFQQRETTKDIRHVEETVFHSARDSNLRSVEKIAALTRTPIDIEQLTEQVVRQIDNRIVAHNERFGKVF